MKRLCIFLISMFVAAQASAHGDCYKARMVAPATFMGNTDEYVELFDGSKWEIRVSREMLNVQYPMATICPKKHLLIVKGVKFYVDPVDPQSCITL